MNKYDEDLYENHFFLYIQQHNKELINDCSKCGWVICVPKYRKTQGAALQESDIADHILQPVKTKESEEVVNYKSLSGKEAQIENGLIRLSKGYIPEKNVKILFEETFHTEQDESFRVICVDNFFNREVKENGPGGNQANSPKKPTTYEQCLDILWCHSGGKKTRDNLDKLIQTFSDAYDKLEGENLRVLSDVASSQFTKAMQILLKDSVVKRASKHSAEYGNNLKIAAEAYLMHSIHKKLFRVITACLASEDAEINKLTRNLIDLQLQDMGIRKIFNQNISPAKKELSKLNQYSTPLGRLFCIKRVVSILTRPPKQSSSSEEDNLMTTDDFLPILIFLIVKSEIPNWMANLVYMQHFHLAKSNDDDEFGFYLASVEAALEHIKSGRIKDEVITKDKLMYERWQPLTLSDSSKEEGIQRQCSANPSTIDEFFKNVQCGDEKAVLAMLNNKNTDEIYLQLCHPLCSCDACDKILAKNRTNTSYVTAYTRDDRGYTALHIAAYYGQAQLIDVLVKYGAVVDATDYLGLTPLHISCQKGFQNVMLLLLHFGADVTGADNDGNTGLHLAAANGHEDCVKGLVFYDNKSIRIDLTNDAGDTALHLAAKWGYDVIVKTLLENGADATIKNRRRQTPISVAQNVMVQRNLIENVDLNSQSSKSPQKDKNKQKSDRVKRGSILKSSSSYSSTSSSVSGSSLRRKSSFQEDYSPTSFITESLGPSPAKIEKQKERLFKAVTNGDIQLVKFYLGVDKQDDDDDDFEDDELFMSPFDETLCHPLCDCPKCSRLRLPGNQRIKYDLLNSRNVTEYTPLHIAVMNSHFDIVQLLLQHGALIDVSNHKLLTPLHLVCFLKHKQPDLKIESSTKITRMLLEHGASVDKTDMNGDTPLSLCCSNGFYGGVEMLLQYNSDPNHTNEKGNTSLHLAVEREHEDIVRLLLQHGADPSLPNRQSQTSLDLSVDTHVYPDVLYYYQLIKQKHRREQEGKEVSERKEEQEALSDSSNVANLAVVTNIETQDQNSITEESGSLSLDSDLVESKTNRQSDTPSNKISADEIENSLNDSTTNTFLPEVSEELNNSAVMYIPENDEITYITPSHSQDLTELPVKPSSIQQLKSPVISADSTQALDASTNTSYEVNTKEHVDAESSLPNHPKINALPAESSNKIVEDVSPVLAESTSSEDKGRLLKSKESVPKDDLPKEGRQPLLGKTVKSSQAEEKSVELVHVCGDVEEPIEDFGKHESSAIDSNARFVDQESSVPVVLDPKSENSYSGVNESLNNRSDSNGSLNNKRDTNESLNNHSAVTNHKSPNDHSDVNESPNDHSDVNKSPNDHSDVNESPNDHIDVNESLNNHSDANKSLNNHIDANESLNSYGDANESIKVCNGESVSENRGVVLKNNEEQVSSANPESSLDAQLIKCREDLQNSRTSISSVWDDENILNSDGGMDVSLSEKDSEILVVSKQDSVEECERNLSDLSEVTCMTPDSCLRNCKENEVEVQQGETDSKEEHQPLSSFHKYSESCSTYCGQQEEAKATDNDSSIHNDIHTNTQIGSFYTDCDIKQADVQEGLGLTSAVDSSLQSDSSDIKQSESGFTELSDSEGGSTSKDLDNESVLSFN